jgi:predicted DNA-binding transcriptional regulator YafY
MQKEKVVKQGGVSASKKLSRLLDVLEYIAKQNGRKVGTFEIQGFLASKGIASDIRTIQRDLNLLQDHFCRLQSDDCNPQGWFFGKDESSQFIAELLKEVA